MTKHNSKTHEWAYYIAGALFIVVMGYFVISSVGEDVAGKATKFVTSSRSVIYLSFDNATSRAGHDQLGTLAGLKTVAGKSGEGVTFDHSPFIYPNSFASLDFSRPHTFGFWARPSPGGVVVAQRYVDDSIFGWKGFDIYVDNLGAVRIRAQSDAGMNTHTQTVLEARAAPITDWAHFVIVTDFSSGSNFANSKLYINGQNVPLSVLKSFGNGFFGIFSNGAQLTVGFIGDQAASSAGHFKGDLDEFRVFEGAFSDSEVLGLYGAPDDADLDGVVDTTDNCLKVSNLGQENADGDTLGNACDSCTDTDGDGFGNPGFSNSCNTDNCPSVSNSAQSNIDHDGMGDACDGSDDRQTTRFRLGASQGYVYNIPTSPNFGGMAAYCKDGTLPNSNVCRSGLLRVCGTCPGGQHWIYNDATNLFCSGPNDGSVNKAAPHTASGENNNGIFSACFNCMTSGVNYGDQVNIAMDMDCQQD